MLDIVKDDIWRTLVVLNYIIAVITALIVIFNNFSPTKTLSYLILLLAFPFVGILFYFLFGQEYRKSKIFKRKNVLNQVNMGKWKDRLYMNKTEMDRLENGFLEDKVRLIKLIYKSEGSPLTLLNNVEIFTDGQQKIERLKQDIESAISCIHMEYYIIKDDATGMPILEALIAKAKEGVDVRLSYDYVGSKISRTTLSRLKQAGAEVYPFMPVYFPRFANKMNYRDHRKIVVIDGKIGYVGGMNISDNYVSKGDFYWRDTHLRIEGEAAGVLQVQFLLNWDFVTSKDVKVEDRFFRMPDTKTKTPVQIAASGPDTDFANIMEVLFTAINTADDYVYITTPYFIPNDEIKTAIMAAAKGGVEVRLLMPEISDTRIAKYAGFSYIEELLAVGVRVYLYEKGFIHAKTLVTDDVFGTVGTANMDYRSFNLNFEINALVYDKTFAQTLKNQFLEDLKDAREILPEVWKKRSTSQKVKESFARIWAHLL